MAKKECGDFGRMDGMDGSCHYCYHEDRELWDSCEKETLKRMDDRHKKFMQNLKQNNKT